MLACGSLRFAGQPSRLFRMSFATAREKSSRPTVPCDGPRMNRQVDVGNPPRPFRHPRMAGRCTPDPSSSRVPVHSALVQKSVTAITNPAGRLSVVMLGEPAPHGKSHPVNSWQTTCIQSNGKDKFRPCKSHSINNGNFFADKRRRSAPAHKRDESAAGYPALRLSFSPNTSSSASANRCARRW